MSSRNKSTLKPFDYCPLNFYVVKNLADSYIKEKEFKKQMLFGYKNLRFRTSYVKTL